MPGSKLEIPPEPRVDGQVTRRRFLSRATAVAAVTVSYLSSRIPASFGGAGCTSASCDTHFGANNCDKKVSPSTCLNKPDRIVKWGGISGPGGTARSTSSYGNTYATCICDALTGHCCCQPRVCISAASDVCSCDTGQAGCFNCG